MLIVLSASFVLFWVYVILKLNPATISTNTWNAILRNLQKIYIRFPALRHDASAGAHGVKKPERLI
jgi:hypothetical protein